MARIGWIDRPSIPSAHDPDFTPSARQIAPMADLSISSPQTGVVAALRRRASSFCRVGRALQPMTGVARRTIFETLLERRRLGTTGVGHGIAIPHGKLTGLPRSSGLFAAGIEDRFRRHRRSTGRSGLPAARPGGAGPTILKALARVSRLLLNARSAKAARRGDRRAHAILTDRWPQPKRPGRSVD